MGHAELQTRRYTAEEYFALEAASEVRHEYFDGEIFAMAGASKSHNLLAQNVASGLRGGLRGKGCQVFMEDVRLVVKENNHYAYPDVLVSCDPDDRRDPYLVRQLVLIVEVLSPSTAEYDRTEKFAQYQKLPSLRHYLLVSQTAWVVEWFRRDEVGQWIYTLLSEPTDVLEIPDLGLHLPLAELYDDTDVAPLRVAPLAQ
ncbi:Uma2 family endonuclease [Hymenobacter caeli]|uniref:Uma2 family endonuclease n=1 Tax=Hymenobacter caeli TaxID=2735894 RepID=A0ABX2FMC5_9BACT|nr:Uma2 family endonuclease [Hymenobacter caeli]NRT18308.1 Uma2 family endonuclease [Hymenobacter caeli]